MPPKPQPSIAERTARRIEQMQQTMPKRIARYLGPAPTMEQASRAQMLQVWNRRGQGFEDPLGAQAQATAMRAQGATDDQIRQAMFPDRDRLVDAVAGPELKKRITFANEMAKLSHDAALQTLQQSGGPEAALGQLRQQMAQNPPQPPMQPQLVPMQPPMPADQGQPMPDQMPPEVVPL